MTNKQKSEILKSICIEGLPEFVREPYQIKAGGKVYETATDGYRLLAFEAAKSSLPTVRSKTKETPAMIVEWLTAKPTHTISDVAGFAGFLNLDGCAKCPMCAGTGKRTPESLHFGEMGFDDPIGDVRNVRISGFP